MMYPFTWLHEHQLSVPYCNVFCSTCTILYFTIIFYSILYHYTLHYATLHSNLLYCTCCACVPSTRATPFDPPDSAADPLVRVLPKTQEVPKKKGKKKKKRKNEFRKTVQNGFTPNLPSDCVI